MFKAKLINREVAVQLVAGLKDFEKDKALTTGLKKSGNVFKKGGRRRLKHYMTSTDGKTGNLLKSMHVRVKKQKLGVLVGFKRPLGNHSHLLDRGTKVRRTTKQKNRGAMPSGYSKFRIGFWMDTYNEDLTSAKSELYNGIEQAVNRIKNRRT